MRNEIKITNEQLNTMAMGAVLVDDDDFVKVALTDKRTNEHYIGVFVKYDDIIYFWSDLSVFGGDGQYTAIEHGFSYSYNLRAIDNRPFVKLLDVRGVEDVFAMSIFDASTHKVISYKFINNAYKQDVTYKSIHGYHSGRTYNAPINSDCDYKIGVELEVECDTSDIKQELHRRFESNWLLMERDGSLSDSRGIEFITIPMCPKHIKSKNTWCDFIEFMSSRAKSWNTSTCGLHVHIGREILGKTAEEQSETIGKLLYLYHHYLKDHPTNIKIYGRARAYEDHDGKVAEGNAVKVLGSDALKVKNIKENLKQKLTERNNTTRYFDINLRNTATIEFRKGKGSLNSDRICSVIEYSELLCLYARKAKWEKISDVDFFEFAKKKVKRISPLNRFISREEADC